METARRRALYVRWRRLYSALGWSRLPSVLAQDAVRFLVVPKPTRVQGYRRTGLPWQMVEIHEPARLAIIVEGTPDRVRRVVLNNAAIERLVRNRWIWLACLDVESNALWEFRSMGFLRHTAKNPLPVVTGESATWYQGKRGVLSPAAIAADAHAERKRDSAQPQETPGVGASV